MTISTLPPPPSRGDSPSDFSAKADALLGALPAFVTEANALQADVTAKQTTASTAATNAAAFATTAGTAATNASSSAGAAAASASDASASATAAAASYDSFDDRYLGSKASAPSVDNDGNALLGGAMYWNSTQGKMYVWTGTSWITNDVLNAIVSGDLSFTGTGVRIKGDFSNATLANRASLQSNVVNGETVIPLLPNGTGARAGFSSPNVPFVVDVGGAEAIRVDTNRNMGVGTTSPSTRIHAKDVNCVIKAEGTSGYGAFYAMGSGGNPAYIFMGNVTYGEKVRFTFDGTNDALYVATGNSATQRLYIGNGGTLHIDPTSGLGYGTGAGGTVTQATSKSTAVTLNKPTGQITMNGAALAANTTVGFLLSNSLISASDGVVLSFGPGVGGQEVNYLLSQTAVAGGCYIALTNRSASSLSESVVIKYQVIKGAVA